MNKEDFTKALIGPIRIEITVQERELIFMASFYGGYLISMPKGPGRKIAQDNFNKLTKALTKSQLKELRENLATIREIDKNDEDIKEVFEIIEIAESIIKKIPKSKK